MNTNSKYRPEKITDVVWASDELEAKIKRYAEGRNNRPLILHGPFGTGKSLIASLIPRALDGDAVQKIFSRSRLFDCVFRRT